MVYQKLNEIIDIRISDIVVESRIRDDLPDIEQLAENIKNSGLIQHIIVNKNNMKLVVGGRRLAAYKLLGREFIPGVLSDLTEEEALLLELRENNQRKNFSFTQKIGVTKLLREQANIKKGRKANRQTIDNNEDKIPKYLRFTNPEIAVEAGWSNEEAMRKALAIDAGAIDVIKDGLNKNLYSLDYAFRGCSLSKKQQLTWHNNAIHDSKTDVSTLNTENKSRRAAKRKAKTKTPTTHKPHPIFNIIRIAPDWDNLIQSDIFELPVLDYAHPQLSVCIVEAPARHIPAALECLAAWDYEYSSIITIYNGKRLAEHLPYTTGDTAHLVIGTRRETGGDPSVIPEFGNLNKLPPVIERRSIHLCESLLPLIGELFPDRKADRRIDMTSTEPVKNFVAWKLTYGDPDATVRATDPVAPSELDLDETDPVDPSELDLDETNPVAPEESDIDATDPVDPAESDDEITFEPDNDAQPVTSGDDLKVFGDED